MKAHDILTAAQNHMKDRAATYDRPEGERSMGATVEAFKAVTGDGLMNTEERGWLFMALLKAVRSQQGDYRADSYEDGAAYFALMGEAAARDRKKPIIRELYTAHPATPNVWEDGEQRMEQIGTNGNEGTHYAALPPDDGWVPHEGGICPTNLRATVRVMMRDGATDINLAGKFRWNHLGNGGDIVKYRLWSPGLK